MTHEEKIQWMAVWAAKNGVQLTLEGECGFGRECVGILKDGVYPDYDYDIPSLRIPEDAYHKHNCVAVLGRGENAEAQLYEWLKWFDENGYTCSSEPAPDENYKDLGMLGILMGKHLQVSMVKK